MYKKPQDKDLGNIHLFNLFSVATTIHKAPKDPCFLVFKPCVVPQYHISGGRKTETESVPSVGSGAESHASLPALGDAGSPWCSLACGHITLIPATAFSGCLLCLLCFMWPSYKDTGHWI